MNIGMVNALLGPIGHVLASLVHYLAPMCDYYQGQYVT
jgi:hypothetical protein